MIRVGYWPDDARGPLFVIAFDSATDVCGFDRVIHDIGTKSDVIHLSNREDIKLFALPNASISLGAESGCQHDSSGIALVLTASLLRELREKLNSLAAESIACHSYLTVGPNLDLIISMGEYSDRQFE